MPLAAAQELALDFELKPAGVTETVTVSAEAPVIDISSARIGVNVSEREVQGLPVNGRQMSQLLLQAPGVAERRHRHVAGHPVLRPRGRAERHQVRRHRRLGHHRRGARQRERREQHAVQAAGEPRERPGVPRRVEQLPGRIRHRHRRPGQRRHQVGRQRLPRRACSSTCATTALDAPNYFDSQRNADGSVIAGRSAEIAAEAEPVRRLHRRPADEEPRVLLRQLRGLPSRRRHELRRGGAERRRVGACRAGDRRAAARVPGSPARSFSRARPTNPDFDIAQLQARRRSREDAFSARLDFKMNDNWSTYVRAVPRPGHEQRAAGRDRPALPRSTSKPTNAVVQPAGPPRQRHDQRVQVRLQRARSRPYGGVAPAGFENIIINLSGSVANTGIAGQGASSGLAIPGGLVRVNSAGNGRSAPYDPYSLTFADTLSRRHGQPLREGRRRRPDDPDDHRPARRHHLHLPNLNSFLTNTPTHDSVFRRPERTEPVPQRRHRD